MTRPHVAPEPKSRAYAESYVNKANVQFARTLHTIFHRGFTYDRMTAHRLALKLIAALPTSGEDVARCLCNFDWMMESATAQYTTSPRYQATHDAAYAAYLAWQSTVTREPAP